MAIKMKGIYKGFKYITQIFVAKEKEMEIGYPTDVKHVTHIGSDTSSCSATAPSWMNVFKSASDFSATSQDFDPSIGRHEAPEIMVKDFPPTVLSNIPKKHGRKKTRPTSPKSSSSRSFRNGFNSRARILEMAI